MQTVTMTITPAQASEWLKNKNTRNRNLSLNRAKLYAEDMKNGNWHKTHQGIAFYEDGVIADGQTRLKAIEISGCPVEMMVTFGVHDSSAIAIDAHRMRSTNDQIAISGKASWIGKNEIAVVNMFGILSGTNKLSTSEIVKFCELHKSTLDFVKEHFNTSAKYISTVPVRCAIAVAYGKEEKTRLIAFCKIMITGVMDEPGDVAAIRLRERLLLDGRIFQTSESGRYECFLLASRAIKAFCDHEQIKKLQLPKDQIYALNIN